MPELSENELLHRYFVFIHRGKRRYYDVRVVRAEPYEVARWAMIIRFGDIMQNGSSRWGTTRYTYYDSDLVALSEANRRCELQLDKGYKEVEPGQQVLAFGESEAMILNPDEVSTVDTVKPKRQLLRE